MHEYMKRLTAVGLPDSFRGCVAVTAIEHDDWCGINKKRECNCDPDISATLLQKGAASRKFVLSKNMGWIELT